MGEVVSQVDAKSQATSFTYDPLGRPATRTEAEGTSIWTWGEAGDNTATNKYIGRLRAVTGPGYAESFTYDSTGRPQTRTITSDTSYQFDYAYNTLGQLDTLTWPTSTAGVRFKAKYGYSGGLLSSVQDYTGNVNGPILWNLMSTGSENSPPGQLIAQPRSSPEIPGRFRARQTGGVRQRTAKTREEL